MALYVGDYLANTGHLTTEEHGAYFLLIMHYWVHESLPKDSKSLSVLARVSLKRWNGIETKLQPLFGPNWTHHRLDQEIDKANEISTKRASAGYLGGKANGKAYGKH
jgi:uncharacterized protein YdaU (DUF1376 family)